jgi:hypothetical protein
MKRRVVALMIVSGALMTGSRLSAHDFWLAVVPWAPRDGAPVTLAANVGEVFPNGTTYTAPERVDQWRLVGAGGDIAVERAFRRDANALVTDLPLKSAGAYLAVMTIAPRIENMKGEEFTDYLKEEGLDRVIAARATAGESNAAARERYARYAKAAVRTGAGDGAHLTRPVGLKAEFIPSTDPTLLRQGQSLTVQLVAGGQPVADAAITAINENGGMPLRGRSDANGRVTYTLDRAGAWLVKTVHMVRLPKTDAEAEAEWESFWVTLAFNTQA